MPNQKICPDCRTTNDIHALRCRVCGKILDTGRRHYNRWFILVASGLAAIIVLSLVIAVPGLVQRLHGNNHDPSPTTSPSSTQTTTHVQLPPGLGVAQIAEGQYIGVNDGSSPPFDIGRATQALKLQAAQQLQAGNPQSAIALWKNALRLQSNDAEALIYIEDQRVLSSGKPHITLVAATSFTPPFPDSQYESELQGVYVAQHQFNDGPYAFQILVLIANSGSDVSTSNTISIAQQIVRIARNDATVMGVIGWLNSSNTENAVKTFADAKIPLISPQASSDYLTGISPYFFRIVSSNKMQAQAAVLFMKNTLNVKKPVVFIDPKDAYSQNLTQDFEDQFSSGEPLHEVTFKTDDTKDFMPLIQTALTYHPDAFYFTSASSVDTALFQDALPTSGAGATIPAFGGDGGYVSHPHGYGRWYFTEYAFYGENEDLPLVKQFVQMYSDDFDPGPHPQKNSGFYGYSLPNDHAILSYDATSVVLTALQAAHGDGKTPLMPDNLKNELAKISGAKAFQGVSGQIAFGSDGDPINKAVVILFASVGGPIKLKLVHGCFIKGCP